MYRRWLIFSGARASCHCFARMTVNIITAYGGAMIMVLRRSIFQVLSKACLLLIAVPVVAQKADARAIKEAQALFRVVMADEPRPVACQFGTEWSQTALEEPIALEFFSLKLRTGLVAPKPAKLGLKDILDPDGQWSEAFCSTEEGKKQFAEWLSAFKSGSDTSAQTRQVEYSFPIFDDRFGKAIVLSSLSETHWGFKNDLSLTRSFETRHSAQGYAKIKGKWRKVKYWETGRALGG